MRLNKITFFRWFSLDHSYNFEGHNHCTYEANIILSGNMIVTIEDKVFELASGDVIIWAPNMFHCNRVGNEKHVEFISVHFNFDGDFLKEKEIVFHHLSRSKIPIVNILLSESETNGYDEGSATLPLLEALIILCYKDSQAPHFFNDNSAKTYGKIAKIMDDCSIINLPKISEMAKQCGVCETTLKEAFKKHTGKSIKKYYNETRIQYAKEMLLEGQNASEVAANLRFSSVSYFSQFFKNNSGMTVREFLSQFK